MGHSWRPVSAVLGLAWRHRLAVPEHYPVWLRLLAVLVHLQVLRRQQGLLEQLLHQRHLFQKRMGYLSLLAVQAVQGAVCRMLVLRG